MTLRFSLASSFIEVHLSRRYRLNTLHNEAIRLYCGLGGERTYNHHPVYTGPFACISPVCGSEQKKVNAVAVPPDALVIQDSGAFNDACLLLRGQDRRMHLMKQQRL